jgi:hypothetical protein
LHPLVDHPRVHPVVQIGPHLGIEIAPALSRRARPRQFVALWLVFV